MTELQKPPGVRFQLKEALSHEPMSLALVTERNLPVFEKTLASLSQESGMLPMTGNANESSKEWLDSTRALWLFGQKADRLLKPDEVVGFVNVYKPELMGHVNDMLTARGMHAYEPGTVVELASYAKNGNAEAELSANKLALQKVFTDETFKDVRGVTVWVDHTPDNVIDSGEADMVKKLGGWAIGTARYSPSESVDSTCFLITRRKFIDAMTGQGQK